MLLYKGKIRLHGSLTNEVWLHNITAPEIAILQRIHGRDAVVDVTKIGEVKKRTDRSERNRLAGIYPGGVTADGKTRLEGETFIDSVLGIGNALATEYVPPVDVKAEDFVAEEPEEIVLDAGEEVTVDEEPIIRTRVPRAKKAEPAADELTAA